MRLNHSHISQPSVFLFSVSPHPYTQIRNFHSRIGVNHRNFLIISDSLFPIIYKVKPWKWWISSVWVTRIILAGLHSAAGSKSYCRARGRKFEAQFGHITFVVIDQEIISKVIPVSILRKSISGRHQPVRVADGPMTARCRFT